MHLIVWKQSQAAHALRAAIEAGEFLLRSARKNGQGEVKWQIPPGYGGLSGESFLGYAHGAAGIADALLDLYACSGDKRFFSAAAGAARWLARLAIPALADNSGYEWPVTEGGEPLGAMWCHGSTGVGRFFLNAHRHRVFPEARTIAERAGRTVGYGARSIGPVQCHGLAGNIEFLVDLFRATDNELYLRQAGVLAELLRAFAFKRKGQLLWCSDQATSTSVEYVTGFPGVATSMLRLADTSRGPGILAELALGHALS
jgi:lantibiotic modifying enzyme